MFAWMKRYILAIALLAFSDATVAMEFGNESMNSALLAAASRGNLLAVQESVRQGADINCRDSNFQTSLHLAAAQGDDEIVKWLVQEADAQTDLKDYFGRKPLHIAVINGHLGVVQWLITKGNVDLNQLDGNKRTALYWSVKYRHVEVTQWLLGQGANMEIRNIVFSDFLLLSKIAGYVCKVKEVARDVLISQDSQWETLLPLLHEYLGWNLIEDEKASNRHDNEVQEALEKLTTRSKCCCSLSCEIL